MINEFVRVCVCKYIYVYIYMYTFTHTCIYICVYMCMDVGGCAGVCMHVRVCANTIYVIGMKELSSSSFQCKTALAFKNRKLHLLQVYHERGVKFAEAFGATFRSLNNLGRLLRCKMVPALECVTILEFAEQIRIICGRQLMKMQACTC